MTQWEYETVGGISLTAVMDDVRELGREGWEIVSVLAVPSGSSFTAWEVVVFLKRPLAEEGGGRPQRKRSRRSPASGTTG